MKAAWRLIKHLEEGGRVMRKEDKEVFNFIEFSNHWNKCGGIINFMPKYWEIVKCKKKEVEIEESTND